MAAPHPLDDLPHPPPTPVVATVTGYHVCAYCTRRARWRDRVRWYACWWHPSWLCGPCSRIPVCAVCDGRHIYRERRR